MKIASLVLTGLLAVATLVPAAAIAADKSAGVTASQVEEFSASKKRYWKPYRVVDPFTGVITPYYVAPSNDFVGGYDGYPGEYAWRRSLGQCVHDLGYGRWKGC